MASAFKQSVFSWVSATALAGAVLAPILVQAQATNPSGFGLRPSVELNLSVIRSLTDGTAQPPASIAPALPSPIIANPIAAPQQPVAAPVQPPAAPAPLDALPSAQYPAAQPAFSPAPHLDPGLVQPTPVVTPVPVQVAAPPTRKVPSQQPYVPPRSLPVYTPPAQTPNQAYALATAQPTVAPVPAPPTPPVSYHQAYTPPPVAQQPAPLSALPPVAAPSVTASRSVAPPVAQTASTPKFTASPLQHGFAVPDEPIPIRVTHLVPFQRGESQAYKLSGASSKNTTGESTAAAEARWSQLSATEKAANPEFQVAVSDLRIRSNAKAGAVPQSKSDLPENANIRERDLIALANERPEPPAKPVVRYEKPVLPPAKKDKPKPKPVPKKPKASASNPAVSVPPPPVVNVKAKPKPVSKDSVKKPVLPTAKKADTKPSGNKMSAKKPAPKLDPAKSDATAPPPKIPPLVKPELVNVPKVTSPPPPPDLVVPDLSNVAPPPPPALAPPKPDAGELADVTPDKLLAPDALVVKREEPALLPEISVPQKGDASKNDTTNAPGLPLAPDAANAADAAEVGLLTSLSNRISDLVTKEPEQQGVLKDETRIINPLEKAGQQSEKLTDAADLKVDKKTVAPAPALELPANLPPPDLALTPPPVDAVPTPLPPVILPHEAAAEPVVVNAKRPQVIAEKPDVSEPTVAAANNLPSLDALKKHKKTTSDKMLQTNDEPEQLPGLPELPAPVTTSDNADGPVVTRGENATATSAAASSDAALEPLPDLPADDSATPEPVEVAALQAAPLAPPPKAVKPKTPAKKADSPSTRKPSFGKPNATVTFSRDVTELNSDAKSRLIDLADDVKRSNKSVRIIAYAEGNKDQSSIARRVSLSRALQVRAFLIDKGVNQLKINVQARGNQLVDGTPNRADIFVRD